MYAIRSYYEPLIGRGKHVVREYVVRGSGITTFGGNNYRNSFAYGTATITDKRLRESWTKTIGALGNWSGTGWTGQPLIVQWPVETVAVMNVKQSSYNFV